MSVATQAHHNESHTIETHMRLKADEPSRTVWAAIRCRPQLWLNTFCILAGILLLLAPLLPRRYEATARFTYSSRISPEIIPLEDAERSLAKVLGTAPAAGTFRLHAEHQRLSGAISALHSHIDQGLLAFNKATQDAITERRAELVKTVAREEAQIKQAELGVTQLRNENPGVLPDEPSGIIAQFEKNQTRYDELKARLLVVNNQIPRLEELRTQDRPANRVESPPAPASASPAVRPVAQDPEVLAIKAQLQLLTEQLDEQLNTMRRTDQHPYVIDLRNKTASLEKKLKQAEERAAAGSPPPAHIQPAPSTPANRDASHLANQSLDVQLQTLRAERDGLADQIRTLEVTLAQQQQKVRSVLPVRERFDQLQKAIAASHTDRDKAQNTLAAIDRAINQPGEAADASVVRKQLARAWVVSAPMVDAPRWPVSPRLDVMLLGTAVLGVLGATTITWLRHRLGRSLQSPGHFAAYINVPVLGCVAEITSTRQRLTQRAVRLGSRVATAGMVLLFASSVALAIQRLGQPDFPQGFDQQAIRSLLAEASQ